MASDRVPVWDALVRLAHWSLAATVAFDYFRDDGDRLHRTVGYVAVGIVAARLLWALVTRGHGRLAALKLSPRETWHYTCELLRGRAPRHIDHDPLGRWMVWALWLLVLALGATGWISRLDAFWGDDRVLTIHAWLANALMVCVVVHLAGVGLMSWLWRENLPGAMISGLKREQRGGR